MGGIGIQQLFILFFALVAIKFHRGLLKVERTPRIRQALLLLYVVYLTLFLITVRESPHPFFSLCESREFLLTKPVGVGPDHIPIGRVLERSGREHSQPRSISVLPGLLAHADRTCPLQYHTSRSRHAGKTRRFPQPEGKETHRQEWLR